MTCPPWETLGSGAVFCAGSIGLGVESGDAVTAESDTAGAVSEMEDGLPEQLPNSSVPLIKVKNNDRLSFISFICGIPS